MISIVMMSYLGDYPGARNNPIEKFNRAVQSVVEQTFQDWELIIVSDGCELTNQEYLKNWAQDTRIKLVKTEKSKSKWPGAKRQIGVNTAKYEWICYLDSDDLFLNDRLQKAHKILRSTSAEVIFDNAMSIIFDKREIKPFKDSKAFSLTPSRSLVSLPQSTNLPEFGEHIYYYVQDVNSIATGTWCIFHRRGLKTEWHDSNKPGEDTDFTRRLTKRQKCEYLSIGSYIIRHSAVRGWDI